MFKNTTTIITLCLLLGGTTLPLLIQGQMAPPNTTGDLLSVTIHIPPESIVYEGDIINCTITGTPSVKYWQINGQTHHALFSNTDPVLFNPEETPFNDTYVNLTVTVENGTANASDTVRIQLKRLYFGDIHFHSILSDGYNPPETMYTNAVSDNYLDFACLTDHAELLNHIDYSPPQPLWMRARSFMQLLMYKFLGVDEWARVKDNVQEFNDPGRFTTFLGFEWSSGVWMPGGLLFSPNNHQDVCHICFLYKDLYEDAQKYSSYEYYTFDDIFAAMNAEYDKGHPSIGFPHHSLAQASIYGAYTVNWTFLAEDVDNATARDRVLRGAEVYSRWGQSIGKYSGIPVEWPYATIDLRDKPQFWVENGLWEWSMDARKNQKFVFDAASDTHGIDRPGSAETENERISTTNPSGIVAAYATHNTRGELWDALNNCSIYGLQTLKIRANVRFDGQMALGQWINCTSPLTIQVTALSTFPGLDSSGRSMCPDRYDPNELSYPIQDVWLVKKDTTRGQPWCKVIGEAHPNSSLAVINFQDPDVQPNDFYYVVVRQKGEDLGATNMLSGNDEYLAFLGPVFIDTVS